MAKLTASEIIYKALVWAEESMEQMVDGDPGEYGKQVADELRQLRAYRRKRFGERPDPIAGTKKVPAISTKWPRNRSTP